jgi:hypothetical protein
MTRMKPCRWCGQPIEPSALRCYHCRTWQRDGADHEDVREAQILDKGIIYWGKFMVLLTTLFVGAVLAAGGFDIFHAREGAREAQMAARTAQGDAEMAAKSAKNEAERVSLDARKLLDDAKDKVDKLLDEWRAKLAKLEQEVDKQKTQIEQQRADFQQQIEYITGRARSLDSSLFGDSLKNQGEAISELQRQITALQEKLAAVGGIGQAAQTPLSSDELAELDRILRIEQTASKVAGSGATGTRQSYDVAFSLCSFVDGACGDNRLSEVSRVIYRFDPKWFSVSDVPVASAANRFSYTLRVWGVTRVRACIFIRGMPDRQIVRVGAMSLGYEPTYWGPDPSAKPDACLGLNSP